MNNCVYRDTRCESVEKYSRGQVRRSCTEEYSNVTITEVIVEMLISICCAVIAFFERPSVNRVVRITAGILAAASFFIFVNTIAAGNGRYGVAIISAVISVVISFVVFRV